MSEYLNQTYQEVLQSIKDNIYIQDTEDYNVFDASFITHNLRHITFVKDFLILGIYRVEVSRMGFYSAPYVHMKNVQGSYEPRFEEIPVKKTFLQKLKLASSPKPEYRLANKYKASLSIEEIIPQNVADEIPLPSQSILVDDWKGEGLWDVFIMDNLKYILPAFGSGNYKERKFITNREQLLHLPPDVSRSAFNLTFDLMPKIEYKKDMAIFDIVYFNEWEGLVRIKSKYSNPSDKETNVIANKLVYPEDEKTVLIGYKSTKRY